MFGYIDPPKKKQNHDKPMNNHNFWPTLLNSHEVPWKLTI